MARSAKRFSAHPASHNVGSGLPGAISVKSVPRTGRCPAKPADDDRVCRLDQEITDQPCTEGQPSTNQKIRKSSETVEVFGRLWQLVALGPFLRDLGNLTALGVFQPTFD